MSAVAPTEAEAMSLRALRRAGGELEIGPDMPLSHALRLALGGYLAVTTDRPQRAVLTRAGRAQEQRPQMEFF